MNPSRLTTVAEFDARLQDHILEVACLRLALDVQVRGSRACTRTVHAASQGAYSPLRAEQSRR